MHISYKKLWKLLIDKDMNKMQLKGKAGISAASVAKLGKDANITTDVLIKVCEALDVKVEDIMELPATVPTGAANAENTILMPMRRMRLLRTAG